MNPFNFNLKRMQESIKSKFVRMPDNLTLAEFITWMKKHGI